jgi:uncharacterized protein (DUF1330 family)
MHCPTLSDMAAYVIADIMCIEDEPARTAYTPQVSTGLEAAGGRYLVRGDAVEVLEGQWHAGRLIVQRTNIGLVDGVPGENGSVL